MNFKRQIDLMNPFQGRKWLKLFRSDKTSGIRFRPNLNISKDVLGFSASTNELGLRGPSNQKAEAVICGTSFAMGMTVDDGENWYELALEKNKWINFGLPVGPKEHLQLLDTYHQGDRNLMLYVYHPNLWALARRYELINYSDNQNVIKDLGWKTDYISALKIYIKRSLKNFIKQNSGELKYKKKEDGIFRLDPNYFYFEMKKNLPSIERQIKILNETFSQFKQVIIVRVPVKEECELNDARFKKLFDNYNELFEHFSTSINHNNLNIVNVNRGYFSFEHYHPKDNHWNTIGNANFAAIIKNLLIKEGLSHLTLK